MEHGDGRLPRVLALADHLGHPGGRIHGATTYYLTVYPRIAEAGVDLTACFMGPHHPAAADLAAAGVEPIFLERRKWDPRALADVLRLIDQRGTDVLHLAAFKSHLLGRIAGAMRGKPSIIHLHDTVPLSPPNRWLQRALARHTALALAVSDPVREFGTRAYGLSPADVRTLHNAIDLSAPRPEREDARRELLAEWALPEDSRLIGIIGRLAPMKGHAFAIRALPGVLATCPQARLVIVGEGAEREHLVALASECGVASSVMFTGQRPDVPRVLAALDVVAIPSMFGEGLPYVALEAIGAGRAVVGFPIAGIPEAVPHDVAGLLVTPGDTEALSEALGRLLGDHELRRRLEEGAKLHAREFSVDAHVERLIAAYRDVL